MSVEYCENHGRYGPCPACQLPHVVIPGSSVLTGSFKSFEEMYEFYGIEGTDN